MQFEFTLLGTWWFSLVYLIFSYGLWFIFPRYVQIKFSKIPNIRYITNLYKYLYILLLVLSLLFSFTINLHFFVGLFLYICGLSGYIISIFYFSINRPELLVESGIYKYSRHPVYLSFFIMWLGVSVSAWSVLIFIITLLIGTLSYFIAIEEEKNCINLYGNTYKNYKNKVQLIFGRK